MKDKRWVQILIDNKSNCLKSKLLIQFIQHQNDTGHISIVLNYFVRVANVDFLNVLSFISDKL